MSEREVPPPTSDEAMAGTQQPVPYGLRDEGTTGGVGPDESVALTPNPTPRGAQATTRQAHEHRQSADTVEVLDVARAWLAEDPDPATRDELQQLLAAEDPVVALGDRFTGRLEFGTAGLRGAVGAGPNRMNRLVVARTTAGLAAYLKARGGGLLVIGYDARRGSAEFAREAAEVAAGAGLSVQVLPRPLPTPVLAFAVRHLGAAAGVMVTASHNPAADNGYKVYLGDGSQIVPPADREISEEIERTGPYATLPRSDRAEVLGDEVLAAYVARAVSVLDPASPREVRAVYTPLHGVGGAVAQDVLAAAGFPAPVVVPEQAEPDAAFPTVPFPNPEEPGALDLALALAQREQADVVIANDPDADRLAVAFPSASGWRALTGDELGGLLAWHLLRRGRLDGGTVAASLVSSSLLSRIAAASGVGFAQTLTGFKWISRVPGLRYGYEEALGYCVDPDGVRDKDGLTAMLVALELVASLRAEGRGVQEVLDELARDYGRHETSQVSLRFSDVAAIPALVSRLRTSPPEEVAGRAVLRVDDLAEGLDGLPPTDGLRLDLEGGARVIVRPSGTEPKVKAYLEVVGGEPGAVVELADGVRALLG
ncbi:phosphomannomutase [Motilibacter rhizosphaerae]|uniref:Phosphomannomutase n=1 Tax=Motilibacter rhizosphaerae TaxID=598652 RepID=A0A4Q7NV08_9ACTN|nr:phospho-sugar mutase [Motilibacter rhizosphaerae]RZS90252.1 phosphomannomutase [Motilibacter rhizosphaerae]